MRRLVVFAGCFLSVCGGLRGQAAGQAGDAAYKFEVASVRWAGPLLSDGQTGIRPSVSGGPETADPERIVYTNTSMRTLLQNAYGVKGDGLSAPDWIATEAYDIAAKIAPGATREQVNVMLQNLSIERFKLAVHHETKQVEGYTLTVAKGGLKMKESTANAEATGTQGGPPDREEDGFPKVPAGVYQGFAVNKAAGRLAVRKLTMAQIAKAFSSRLALAPVVDKTGLTGTYDFTLYFAPGKYFEDFENDLEGLVQKELGLKLEKGKVQIDVVVIDHLEKVPTEN